MAAGVLALAGCASDEPFEIDEDLGPDTCGADVFPVGISIEDAGSVEAGGPVRVIRPGQAVTQDYNPSRLNLVVDSSGVLSDAYCG